MLKVKYTLDLLKIQQDGKYLVSDVVYSAEQKFARYGLQKVGEGLVSLLHLLVGH